MSSDALGEQLDQVRRQYRDNVAPANTRAEALARFGAARPRPIPWPAWGLAAAVICAAVLIPNVVRDDDAQPVGETGVAGLSLNQLELPPRPQLPTPGQLSSSELSSTTSLPLGIPNLSQLSVPQIEAKETI